MPSLRANDGHDPAVIYTVAIGLRNRIEFRGQFIMLVVWSSRKRSRFCSYRLDLESSHTGCICRWRFRDGEIPGCISRVLILLSLRLWKDTGKFFQPKRKAWWFSLEAGMMPLITGLLLWFQRHSFCTLKRKQRRRHLFKIKYYDLPKKFCWLLTVFQTQQHTVYRVEFEIRQNRSPFSFAPVRSFERWLCFAFLFFFAQ